MQLTKKSKALVAGAALVGLAGSGTAYAYWTTSGTGTGTATTGTSSAVIVNQTSPTGVLYPGSSAALSGNFDNSGTSPQYVAAVTAAVKAFSYQPDPTKPACTQADFSITGTSSVPGDVPAGVAKGAWSGLSINMPTSGSNQDNCKSLTAAQLVITYAAS